VNHLHTVDIHDFGRVVSQRGNDEATAFSVGTDVVEAPDDAGHRNSPIQGQRRRRGGRFGLLRWCAADWQSVRRHGYHQSHGNRGNHD
jgi:hypothetical protein